MLPQISSSTSDSRGSSQSSDLGCDKEQSVKRVHHLSETSEGSSDSGDYLPSQEVIILVFYTSHLEIFTIFVQEQAYIDAQLQLLLEMFPTVCNLEVRHCLAIAGGDVEQAAQLVLHRQDAGESLTASSVQVNMIHKQRFYLFTPIVIYFRLQVVKPNPKSTIKC